MGRPKQLFFTTEESDFMLFIEVDGADGAGASGMAATYRSVQAWTGAEVHRLVEKAAGIPGSIARPWRVISAAGPQHATTHEVLLPGIMTVGIAAG